MSDNNKLPEQAKPQEFELVELLFREYVSSHIARPDIEYSFQARFQSFIDQIPSYLHSVSKTGFFTHFFFGSFASLLDTQLADTLALKKLHFNFESADNLRIVAETNDKMHVFIFTENNKNKKQNKNKDIGFTKDEWKTITGREYTDDDNKKLEINIININKSTGSINVTVEKKDIQDGASSTKRYHEITKQCVDKDGQYVVLEGQISELSLCEKAKSIESLDFIFKYIKLIHDHYQGLPYGDQAREADEHGFVAGIFNNFRYRENVHGYLEQFAGKGYADMVLLVRGSDRTTKSIPIIIELKAGTGRGTTPEEAFAQVKEYIEGFQPNNMRILSLADNILCVGMNLDSPSDSFMQMKVVARDQEAVPLIQSLTDSAKKIKDSNIDIIKQEIQSNLEKTYNTFPGTGEKSSAHYMSRFLLGESLVLRDYDKHILIYDQESYIPTATVIDDHGTRSKKPKIEKIVDGSNAVNSILFITTSSADAPAILVNIIDINRDVVVNNIRLDSELIGNRKIVQLNIQFNIDKYKESFEEYCKINLLKIYGSISEYNQASVEVKGQFYLVDEEVSDNLSEHLQQAISSQEGLVISESRYKELMGKVGEIVYPIKSLIGRESEFQGLLEGIFKYCSDVSLSEGVETRALILTEFQTGAGGRIDMLLQVIGPSEKGSKEYVPVGFELKYDDSIKLDSHGKKQDENIQRILLERQEQRVIQRLLNEQIERYANGAAIKSITDGNKVAIIGVVFNNQAQESSKLLLTTDKLLEANIVHSSKLYTISHGVVVPNINDLPAPDSEEFIPDWVEQEILDEFAKMQGEDRNLLSLFNKNIDDDKITRLQNVFKNKEHVRIIDGIDLSYNDLTVKGIPALVKVLGSKLIYLDLSDNDLAQDNFADFKEFIKKIEVPILKISDIGMNNQQMREAIALLKKQDKISHLEIQHLTSQRMSDKTAHSISKYIADTHMLDYLDLSRCGIKNIAARIIANSLLGQNTLRTLILRDNKIGADGTQKFKSTLPNSAILHFDLSGNPLGVAGFANIVEAVVSSSSNVEVIKLVDVGVKYNRDNRVQAECLTNAIKSLFSNKKLTSIDISYNDMGTGLLSQTFNILSKAVDGHSLRDISLAGNKIDWGSHQATINSLKGSIKEFFENNETVRSLGMADMELNDELGEEIAQGVEKNGALIHLDLSGNTNLDIKTISALASTLRTHQYLKYLNLSDIKLNIKKLKILFGAVNVNNALTHLDISHNNLSEIFITSHGNRILGLDNQYVDFQSLLKDNTSLKYLNLSHCKLTTNSLKSLFVLAKEHSSLEILNVRGNNLDDEVIDYILGMEDSNKGFNSLKILYFDKGNLSDDSVSKLKSLGISVLVDDDVSSEIKISDLGKEECIIPPVNPKISYPFMDMVPLTLEQATLRHIYDYWLQQHDIPDIARVHYNYQLHELEVVGSNEHLSYVLRNYRSSEHTHPFTIILNIGQDGDRGNHWVSVVLHRVNNKYHAYYTDSLGQEIPGSTARILNNNGILIHDMSIMQQSDGHNCGLWALENASTIRRILENNNNPEMFNLPRMNQEELEELRRAISNELRNDDVRLENIEHYNLAHNMVIPRDYASNSHIYQQSVLLLEECISAFAMLHITSNNMPKHKRSIMSNKQKINAKEFLECTNKMKTDITNFYLMILLKKFQILDDSNCNKVNKFVSYQESIDEIKQYKALGTNAHSLVKAEGLSLILLAGQTHNINLFKLICKRYSDQLNDVDHSGQTILHKVVFFPDPNKWVKFLINQKIDVNIRDKHGNTALNYAIEQGLYQVPKLLIQHGADVNNINNYGQTLLHYALKYNSGSHLLNIVKLLVSNGAQVDIQDQYSATALDYGYQFNAHQDVLNYLIVHGARSGVDLIKDMNSRPPVDINEFNKAHEDTDIKATEFPVDTYIFSKPTTKPEWLQIRHGDGGSLRKKRVVEYTSENHAIEQHNNNADILKELQLNRLVDYDTEHHKHRHHNGEWHKRAKHLINKKHNGDHHRERRDLEDTLKNNDNKQLHDKLVATQEQHVISNTDSRYDAVVQVQNAIGTRHTIARDASKFIDSKPVVNSVYNKLVVDWQGNLLLGYLLFGKKCSGAKCEITQEVVNEPKDLEYAHRLAYSSYAPVIEQNIKDTELVGEV